jgi:hypothetical protein
MEMYRGSYQSVTMGWKPFLNIDVANKAFPSATKVVNLIEDLFGKQAVQGLKPYEAEKLGKFLKTLKVN